MRTFIALGIAIYSFIPHAAHAFPEMIRHGYVNCTTCHISPNGGGVLNDYGRGLSKELLATWKSEDESSTEHLAAYGALEHTSVQKWLKLGGDVRSLYLYQNNPYFTEGQTMVMQGNVEAAVVLSPVTVAGTLDYQNNSNLTSLSKFSSSSHYALYNVTDEFSVRVGKFIPAYGINTADHVSLTRTGIHEGQFFESYNAELSYLTDRYSVFVTGIVDRPATFGLESESGAAVQGSYSFSETNKIGLNVLLGNSDHQSRVLAGGFGLIGITQRLMFMTEFDVQQVSPSAMPRYSGFLSTQKASYELWDGIWGFAVQEYGITQFAVPLTQSQVYGIGFQFFPRTHFELNVSWEKILSPVFASQYYDYAWLVGHFYL